MFQYFKQLLNDAIVRAQNFVDDAENSIIEIPIANENFPNYFNAATTNSSNLNVESQRSSPIDIPNSSKSQRACEKNATDKNPRLEKLIFENSSKISKNENSEETKNMRINDMENFDDDDDDPSAKDEKKKSLNNEKCRKNEICNCENCSTVRGMSECAVCLEPLQIRGIRCCPLCANIVCSTCSSRIKRCAFCRICLPMQRNRALERLFEKMSLPCRNARNGCPELLKSSTRLMHEMNCDHASMGCPLLKGSCNWQGNPRQVLDHLKQFHSLKPLASHEMAIEVTNYHHRSVKKLRECTAYMSCYGQLFAIKVTPSETKLTLSFYQLGQIGRFVDDNTATMNYDVAIKVHGGRGKRVRGVLTFGKNFRGTRDIEFDDDCFVEKSESDGKIFTKVNIDIAIRRIVDKTKK